MSIIPQFLKLMYSLLLHQRNGAHLAPLRGVPGGDKETAVQSAGVAVLGVHGYRIVIIILYHRL